MRSLTIQQKIACAAARDRYMRHHAGAFALFALFLGSPHAGPLLIATVGTSITAFSGYPEKLDTLLGDSLAVFNAGEGGAGLLRNGGYPYFLLPKFTEMFARTPDIITIELGTNDCRGTDWQPYGNEFGTDLEAMADTFATMATRPIIWLCFPPPLFGVNAVFEDTLLYELIPQVQALATRRQFKIIDLHTPFINKPGLFPDGVHPSAEGADSIAAHFFAAFRATPMVRLSAYRVDFAAIRSQAGSPQDVPMLARNPMTDMTLAGLTAAWHSAWLSISIDSADKNRRTITHHADVSKLTVWDTIYRDTVTIETSNGYPRTIWYPVSLEARSNARTAQQSCARNRAAGIRREGAGCLIVDVSGPMAGDIEIIDMRGVVRARLPAMGPGHYRITGLRPGMLLVRGAGMVARVLGW